MRKPKTILDDATAFLSSAISSPISFLGFAAGSPPKSTPEEVSKSDIDLNEDEILEQERGEEGEVDDSTEAIRKVRVLSIANKMKEDRALGEKTRARRRWQVIPLRKSKSSNSRIGA